MSFIFTVISNNDNLFFAGKLIESTHCQDGIKSSDSFTVVGQINKKLEKNIYAPQRWGFDSDAIADLGKHLHSFWEPFKYNFITKTKNTAGHALTYLKGLLLMDKGRNYANIARRVSDPSEDDQKMQHFMSDSPWSSESVIKQVQDEIKETSGLEGGFLLLDESADEKAGGKSAGASRQHNGRLGKIEMSQVGVFLAYYKDVVWNWVNGELFIPEHWFEAEMSDERERVGVPKERKFVTKVELGWQMIERAKNNLRREMAEAGIVYMADVPENKHVYLSKPDFGVPVSQPGRKGRAGSGSILLMD